MPLDFPGSPNQGDTYTFGDITFEFDGTKWFQIPAASAVNLDDVTTNGNTTTNDITVGGISINGEIVEEVYALTGTTPALDPANGTIQTWTLSGNSTPTDSLAEGESITLLIDDGTAYTITWPTMEWIGGSAPTLDTAETTVVVLWKTGSTLQGSSPGVLS